MSLMMVATSLAREAPELPTELMKAVGVAALEMWT
jgi:hypothetical protein